MYILYLFLYFYVFIIASSKYLKHIILIFLFYFI